MAFGYFLTFRKEIGSDAFYRFVDEQEPKLGEGRVCWDFYGGDAATELYRFHELGLPENEIAWSKAMALVEIADVSDPDYRDELRSFSVDRAKDIGSLVGDLQAVGLLVRRVVSRFGGKIFVRDGTPINDK